MGGGRVDVGMAAVEPKEERRRHGRMPVIKTFKRRLDGARAGLGGLSEERSLSEKIALHAPS